MPYAVYMTIRIKRVYDRPVKADGARVLVDRLWPRGVSKEEAAITVWAREFAPSNDVRKWFHVDPEGRYSAFARKYHSELRKNKRAIAERLARLPKTITLVTSVKDVAHSHIPTLKTFLESLATA